ncbi:MAG: aminoglycoside phosphotransferase [Polaromonas sp.]|nr:aminoglycoside phosphotransferase [Polaromonas sp.]
MNLEFAQSTPTARSIGAWVEAHYALGPVVDSEFLRRSFNQVYRLTFASGRRVVARLSADRPRGRPNVQFEAAALGHWAAQGALVANCIPAANGDVSVDVPLPEGGRPLMLFDFLEGAFTGDAPADIQAFGRGLAHLHTAGQGYGGVASAYTLDLEHLLWRPLQRLLQAPTVTPELRPRYQALAQRLNDRIVALGPLTQVLCHGDAHGQNNFVVDGPNGHRQAVFFDFDEAGPGYLAYELAVYPWSQHPHLPDTPLSDKTLTRWRHFLDAYRAVRPVDPADLAAIAPFMAVRQFWLLGEYAGRTAVWGSQAMPTDYLQRQATVLTQWEDLALPS